MVTFCPTKLLGSSRLLAKSYPKTTSFSCCGYFPYINIFFSGKAFSFDGSVIIWDIKSVLSIIVSFLCTGIFNE